MVEDSEDERDEFFGVFFLFLLVLQRGGGLQPTGGHSEISVKIRSCVSKIRAAAIFTNFDCDLQFFYIKRGPHSPQTSRITFADVLFTLVCSLFFAILSKQNCAICPPMTLCHLLVSAQGLRMDTVNNGSPSWAPDVPPCVEHTSLHWSVHFIYSAFVEVTNPIRNPAPLKGISPRTPSPFYRHFS